jgi:large repetitive protein
VTQSLHTDFAAIVSDPDHDPVTITWDFGDHATASGATAAHDYAVGGTYPVTLRADDHRGRVLTVIKSVVVDAAPTGSFTFTTNGWHADFHATGSDPENDPLTFTWDFGDGGTAAGAVVGHDFNSGGPHHVSLAIDDGHGNVVHRDRTVTVNAAPASDFTWVASGLRVTFSEQASDPDGDALSYSWDFGDGATSTGANPTHDYPAGGSYTVTLTVDDGNGHRTAASHTVAVTAPNAAPTGDFTTAAILLHVDVVATASDPDGDPITYTWDWGDGSATATGVTAGHDYAASGTYTITLTLDDGRGGVTTVQHNITI